jgi:predicted Zn-ribbon and HTH transcriptional regulator
MDPLAVLMARVWTEPTDDDAVERLANDVIRKASQSSRQGCTLPWIDDNAENSDFLDYWFGIRQQLSLRAIASTLADLRRARKPSTIAAADVLRIALSRIIITKDSGASLARDVSHSRPHKTAETSSFEVMSAFSRSVSQVRRILAGRSLSGKASVALGDARSLPSIGNNSIDAVLTSPPYLNAIDYMRGHRLSLIWLGYGLSELRAIRSTSIGAERGANSDRAPRLFDDIKDEMCDASTLSSRHALMVARYAEDVYRLMSEIARVTKRNGKAILVVGNSCLKGTFIRNTDGVARAGAMVGLRLANSVERKLPDQNRYLPTPSPGGAPLAKRMRTETVLTFTIA